MSLDKFFATVGQPFAFGSSRNWVRLLWRNKRDIEPAYLGRLLFVLCTSFSTAPLRVYERARYGNALKKVTVEHPPIFIIGHWRSGTTHLHLLMCQDANLGYTSTFQTTAPELCLVGEKTLKPVFDRLAPTTRGADNMTYRLDNPEEEEFALTNLTLHSFYHYLSFPRHAQDYFEKYALLQDLPPAVIAAWKEAYLSVLRKATFKMGGKRLILKNPVNTGRVKVLLEMFPQAKFIHIYRNPYDVLLSMRHLSEYMLSSSQFHQISPEKVEANMLSFYEDMLQRFLADKALIPPGNLAEVKFEDLEAQPLAELRRLYEELALPGFAQAEAAFRAYIASQAGYQKNKFELSSADVALVNQHWRFAFEEWGYDLQTCSA
jgi:hypothetical protein